MKVWIQLRGVTNFNFVLVQLNLRKQSINIKRLSADYIEYLKNSHFLLKMDYDLVDKMHVNELKNYLEVCKLKISSNKNECLVLFLLRRMLCQ